MCKNLKQLSFALLALSAGLFSASAVTVPNVFSANMVLQRDTDVPVWGWGDDGETVTVTFRDQTVSTKVKDGKWTVKLHSLKTGDPATLTITGNNTIDFTNVVVGEVWVASGQSNMEFSMGRKPLTAADLPSCTNTMIRWLNVRNTRLDEPTNNVQATWLVSSPQTMPTNSAVAYYFAKDLQKTLGVPIGIMESDWGGTPIEAWLRREVIAANPVHKKQVIDAQDAALALYQKEIAAPEKSAPPKKGAKKTDAPKKPWMPGELYNGMIAPLIPYAIKGVIWYQGENNSSSPTNALRYHSLFPDLIKSVVRPIPNSCAAIVLSPRVSTNASLIARFSNSDKVTILPVRSASPGGNGFSSKLAPAPTAAAFAICPALTLDTMVVGNCAKDSTGPSAQSVIRSMQFFNSRMLPGQS